MWNRRVLSTLGRQDRSRSYVDRTPKSCPGSWDAPKLLCAECGRPVRLNASGVVIRHGKVK